MAKATAALGARAYWTSLGANAVRCVVQCTKAIGAAAVSSVGAAAATGLAIGVPVGMGLNQIPEVAKTAEMIFWPITDWMIEKGF